MICEEYKGKYFSLIDDHSNGCRRCVFIKGSKCTMPDEFPFACTMTEHVHELSDEEYALARLKGEI